MNIQGFIKVPAVLIENVVFSLFPTLRPLVERYVFNPLDFKEDHIVYSQKKFEEFEKHTSSFIHLENKTFLELGPGGSIGLGILALEKGVKKYFAIDDGTHTFIRGKQIALYTKLLNGSEELFKKYFTYENGRTQYNPQKIAFGSINQQSQYPLENDSVDIIYSCAVLEHVHDLELCFSEMSRVLKDGGLMYHEVDLRDHIFSQQSLWFLTLTDSWFRFLFKNTGGYVNRMRVSGYKALAKKYNLRLLSCDPTKEYTSEFLPEKIRSRYSPEDIKTLAFIMVLRKDNTYVSRI